jgi:hypothetical protein
MAKQESTLTRADQVRERREAQKKQSKKRRSSGKPLPGSAQDAPVFARYGKTRVPMRAINRQKARRRFDISLGVGGAELKLPALPSFVFSARLISGALTAVLAALIINIWTGPMFRVSAPEIEGLERIQASQVEQILGLNEQSIIRADPEADLIRLRKSFPEFAHAQIQIELPNRITIQVAERSPVLQWKSPAGTYLFDRAGFIFQARGGEKTLPGVSANFVPEVPKKELDPDAEQEEIVVEPEGFVEPQPVLSVETVSAILALNEFIPEGAVLQYDEFRGLGWEDPQGWQVFLGPDMNDFEQKMRVYQALVANLDSQGIRPAVISVEFLHAPYYRLDR